MKYLIHNTLIKILQPDFPNIKEELEVINNLGKNYHLFGEYSINLPLKLSKQLKENPMIIAEKIQKIIEKENNPLFEKVEVMRPGFINFFLSQESLQEEILKFFDENYKPTFDHLKKDKINYEYVSANPTGFLHIGHARNAIVGDITVKLLKYVGNEVYTEYYINDYGNQINNLTNAVNFYYQKALGNDVTTFEEPQYKGKEIITYGELLAKEFGKEFELLNEENFLQLKEKTLTHFLEEIKKTLASIKIAPMDEWVSETTLYTSDKVSNALKALEESNKTYQKDGATWLKTTEYGDDKDRVLLKEDGGFTYLVGDIANHIFKLSKGYNKLINLWGKDHHGYETRVKASLSFLGHDDVLEVDYISMVQILNKGEVVKMSKRAGTSLTINEMLKDIEPNLLRYFIVSKSKEQNLEIDINKVKEENSNNPFFYMQYANARTNQLLEKYFKTINDTIKIPKEFKNFLQTEKELDLVKNLLQFEEIISNALLQREPSMLVNYLKVLANSFHSYYNDFKIIGEDKEQTNENIILVKIYQNVANQVLDLLGIETFTKM